MTSLTERIKQLIPTLPRLSTGDWWIEVTTSEPNCIYYFGPFATSTEANTLCPGYVHDLINEGAEEIYTVIKRCQPSELTKWEPTQE